MKIIDLNNFKEIHCFKGTAQITYDFKNFGNYYISSNSLGKIDFYNNKNFNLEKQVVLENNLYQFDYCNNLNELVVGDEKGNVIILEKLDLNKNIDSYENKPFYFKAHCDAVKSIKLGKYLFSGSRDGVARIWNAENFKFCNTLTGHKDQIVNGDFHPNKNLLVTSSWDQTINIYDISKFNN